MFYQCYYPLNIADVNFCSLIRELFKYFDNFAKCWLSGEQLLPFELLGYFFFSKLTFSEKSFRNTIRMSNSLDPDLSGLIWVQKVSGAASGAPLAHLVECQTLDCKVAVLNLTWARVLCS